MKNGTGRQALTLDREIGEPGPPLFKLVELLEPIPQPVGRQVEAVATLIGDDGRRHRLPGYGLLPSGDLRGFSPVGTPTRPLRMGLTGPRAEGEPAVRSGEPCGVWGGWDGMVPAVGHRPASRGSFSSCLTGEVSVGVTVYGVCAVSFMMVMYALERRGRQFTLLFALGCLLSSAYGFLSGAWPFGVVEFIWSGIAVRRWHATG